MFTPCSTFLLFKRSQYKLAANRRIQIICYYTLFNVSKANCPEKSYSNLVILRLFFGARQRLPYLEAFGV